MGLEGTGIGAVSKSEFVGKARSGDLVFCCGRADISKAIEDATHSPFSHVLMTWRPPDSDEWLTIESTFHHGVHVGQLSAYIEEYDGDLVLARRPVLTDEAIRSARDAGLRVLDDGYDWKQEVSIVGHRLLKCIPVEIPKKEYFCSGLQYFMSLATEHPLRRPGPNYPTPEDIWCDPTVVPVCALMRGTDQLS
jgi:Permuted papain-like amidase enzyme, YaeF/YiiX, C92 family